MEKGESSHYRGKIFDEINVSVEEPLAEVEDLTQILMKNQHLARIMKKMTIS